MASSDSSPEGKSIQLLNDLNSYVKLALNKEYRSTDNVLNGELTLTLCNVIEAIFINGLREGFYLKITKQNPYPQPNFWPIIYKSSNKETTKRIADLKQIKTEIGKARVWVRIHVNEKTLVSNILTLIDDKKAIGQIYNANAFLCDTELTSKACTVLRQLEVNEELLIQAAINSSMLNSWTPNPLIFAGIVHGKRKKANLQDFRKNTEDRKNSLTGSLRKESLTECELEEIGEAVEALGHFQIGDEVNIPYRTDDDANEEYGCVDDQSSIISYNSIHDDTSGILDCYGQSPINMGNILSSTPNNDSFFPLNISPNTITEHLTATVVFKRRKTKLPRRPSANLLDSRMNSSRESNKSIKSEESNVGRGILRETDGNNLVYSASCPQRSLADVLESQVSMFGDRKRDISLSDDMNELAFDNFEESNLNLDEGSIEQPKWVSQDSNSGQVSPKEELKSTRIFNSIGVSSEMNSLTSNEHCLENTFEGISHSFSSGNSLSGRGWKRPSSQSSPHLSEKTSTVSSLGGMTAVNEVELVKEEETVPVKNEKESKMIEDEFVSILKVISNEKGIETQDYKCLNCEQPIGANFARFKVCQLDKKYYCKNCMKKGKELLIPARVILNGDFRLMPVSPRYEQLIRKYYDKPIFDVEEMNKNIYGFSKKLSQIHEKRRVLCFVSLYLLSCKDTTKNELIEKLHGDDSWITRMHLFSWKDFEDIVNGSLEKKLNGLITYAIDHVFTCQLCSQKGFICELCPSTKIIYPFQDFTVRCSKCYSVYHKTCFKNDSDCPKCERKARISETMKKNFSNFSLFENNSRLCME
uniref:RUN domain-containing protein n=1 Tax=Rhabditophanes sp. KR3021 TaxID=114890 RepID=A0AC35TUZ0_9BILA